MLKHFCDIFIDFSGKNPFSKWQVKKIHFTVVLLTEKTCHFENEYLPETSIKKITEMFFNSTECQNSTQEVIMY